jgi:predicted dehydrogenase
MARKTGVSRRDFLKGAAAAVAAPYVLTSTALGAGGRPAASGRIVMGAIGLGGQGQGDMGGLMGSREVQMVAVCDVDRDHREKARAGVNKHNGNNDCAGYNDFRELLARDDIDAVLIATPDHWHAILVIEAARAGKDMYCEKPLSLTIRQGRAMSDAVRRYGRVFQTGSQQRSDDRFRFACELVRNGRIGKLVTMKVGLPGGSGSGPKPPVPVPDGFDYDFWLGPAPWAPYFAEKCHWNFRWQFDYSGGQVTDWGAHHCDIGQWGNGTEYTGPTEVWGSGKFPDNGPWNTATEYQFFAKYPNGAVMDVSSRYPNGVRFEGTEGWVFVSREKIEAEPQSLLRSTIGPNEIHLYESRNHTRNFVECVLTRRPTIAPIEVAHRSITIAHLGNIAMLTGRKIKWDPDKEQIVGDAEANRMLGRAMQAPWRI